LAASSSDSQTRFLNGLRVCGAGVEVKRDG
jgi:hypothetical protein